MVRKGHNPASFIRNCLDLSFINPNLGLFGFIINFLSITLHQKNKTAQSIAITTGEYDVMRTSREI